MGAPPPTWEDIINSHQRLAVGFVAALTAAAATSNAALITLNSPTVGPNQPGTFFVTGTITVGPGEAFLSPNTVSTVALPLLPAFVAGFNYNCGNFDANVLAWNGLSTYTGNILDFTVNPNNFGYSGGMPLGVYNFNPGFPGSQPGISLDYIDPNGVEHTTIANYQITVAAVPEPASLAALALGAAILKRKRIAA